MDFLSVLADAVQKGGWLGYVVLLIGIVGALMTGTLQSRREVDALLSEKDKALYERDKRYEEMKADRDFWHQQSDSLGKSLETLTGVMEAGQRRHGG